MKKFFTTVALAIALSMPILAQDTTWDNAPEISWNGEAITASKNNPAFILPGIEKYVNLKIVSNSKTDLLAKGYGLLYSWTSLESENAVELKAEVDAENDNNYVYTNTDLFAYFDNYFYYDGDEEIKFTFQIVPKETVIVPEEAFDIDGDYPVWTYTPEQEVANFYFQSDSNVNLLTEDDSQIIFAEDEQGQNLITLQAQVDLSGNYIFSGTNLKANTPYYLILKTKNPYASFTLTLYEEEFVMPEVGEISFDTPFIMSPDKQYYAYTSASEIPSYYIQTNSDENLLESGALEIIYGYNIFTNYEWDDWEAVVGKDGYCYNNGIMQEDGYYLFHYTGSEPITLTLIKGSYTPDGGTTYIETYASPYTFDEELSEEPITIEVSWGVPVMIKDDTLSIMVSRNSSIMGPIASDSYKLVGLTTNTLFGNQLAITLDPAIFNQLGIYELHFPEGLVADENGAINQESDVYVTLSEPTAISSIQKAEDGAVIYNLQGQKVANPSKGLYIVNGKKVMVK